MFNDVKKFSSFIVQMFGVYTRALSTIVQVKKHLSSGLNVSTCSVFLYFYIIPPYLGNKVRIRKVHSTKLEQDFGCQIDYLAKCCHKVCKFGHIWLPK